MLEEDYTFIYSASLLKKNLNAKENRTNRLILKSLSTAINHENGKDGQEDNFSTKVCQPQLTMKMVKMDKLTPPR
jgi:hypothetical protein